ncbi:MULTISPECIES: thiaminase II [Heyndrickxia]|uniref:thiaminase II n=1 Tax=Heyndrickxia TaxID=2837504 RepID=UPI0007792D4D|nr:MULTISPECIES: thiaminase II [Heyndrickxia]AVD55343.1 thiaminase II [Heyndrickxia coagulans]AWP36211.1 thiaminase II [Heyndrickxia coagulans]KYC67382.1 Thiaminase II [Heyndrickxia coagulans]MED4840466.1 thiaminase II [Weizmannia sp. CD-2023]MED4900134.1 thiaminase II [Weizmannia sp. CD-2023]
MKLHLMICNLYTRFPMEGGFFILKLLRAKGETSLQTVIVFPVNKEESLLKRSFTERLYQNVQPIWEKNHNHPFVVGLGNGTLERDKFIYYLKQDYVYLVEYAKLFAMGVVKAGNLDIMTRFAAVLHESLHFEMELHRQYAAEFGITRTDLEATQPTPANLAYTSYMLQVAANGGLAELVACLLPCAWDYWEIGKLLKVNHRDTLEANPYKKWIETYSSETFGSGTQWLIDLMDQLASGKSETELMALERHFQMASKYEYLFWDMNDKKQDWPV